MSYAGVSGGLGWLTVFAWLFVVNWRARQGDFKRGVVRALWTLAWTFVAVFASAFALFFLAGLVSRWLGHPLG